MKQEGFTLVEAVVGMLILAVGTLGFCSLAMSGASIEKKAMKLTTDSDQSLQVKAHGEYEVSSSEVITVSFTGVGPTVWKIDLDAQVRALDGLDATSTPVPDVEMRKYTYFDTTSTTLTKAP